MRNRRRSASAAILLVLGTAGLLTGCGPRPNHQVNIEDNGQRTEMLVYEGDPVEAALADAGICLQEKDQITVPVQEAVMQDMDIRIDRYAKVTVKASGKDTTVELNGGHVADALTAAGVALEGHDYIRESMEEWLTDGMNIEVIHRVETALTMNGKTEKCLTEMATVEDFLKEQEIELGELDRITPELTSELAEGMEIRIQRVGQKEEKVTEEIDFTTTTKKDPKLAKGKTKVSVEGVKGEKELIYRVTYVDGVEESRELISETVTKKPVEKVIMKGTYVAPKKPSSQPDNGKKVVSREYYDDCDGSGHGVCKITYSDGTVVYKEY